MMLLLQWGGPGPSFNDYVLMENTEAEGEVRDFDMGQVQGNGNLDNVAPYIFVQSGGSSFTSPFSASGVYNADTWESGGAPYGAGAWNLFIRDNGPQDPVSVGSVTVRYCGVCTR